MNHQKFPNFIIQDIHHDLINILPEQSGICVRKIDCDKKEHLDLYQKESFLTNKMSKKRLADFSSGRLSVKSALLELNIRNFPLLINSNRSPAWPNSVVGSISHSKNICIAAVNFNINSKALGIDIETTNPLNTEVLPLICNQSEILHLNSLAKNGFGDSFTNAKIIFSIKESIFKCLNPHLGCWIDFKEMLITLNPQNKSYLATPKSENPLLTSLKPIKGYWFSNDYFHVSSCWI